MKRSSTNLQTWVARIVLFGIVYLFVSFNLQAEIWLGMPKGKLFKELGAPISNLAAGPKELHNLSDGRKIGVLNGRVTAFSSAGAKAKRVSEFNDFKAIENTP